MAMSKRTVFTVYRITNSINAMQYIGCTEHDLAQRWTAHKAAMRSERDGWKPLYQAMREYGVENFSIEAIAGYRSKFEMRTQETLQIRNGNTLWPNGYNLVHGRVREEVI